MRRAAVERHLSSGREVRVASVHQSVLHAIMERRGRRSVPVARSSPSASGPMIDMNPLVPGGRRDKGIYLLSASAQPVELARGDGRCRAHVTG
jgi:hypothetical protein